MVNKICFYIFFIFLNDLIVDSWAIDPQPLRAKGPIVNYLLQNQYFRILALIFPEIRL